MLGVQQVQGGLSKMSKAKKVFIAGVVTMLLVSVVGSAWFTLGRSSASDITIPATIQESADFPLYFPEKLPKGYTINPNSFGATKEVVTYSLNYDKDSNLAVSLQPLPLNFDFEKFYEKSMRGSASVTTAIGTARIGVMNGVETVSLTTDKTWILMSSPNGANDSDLRSITQSFRLISAN